MTWRPTGRRAVIALSFSPNGFDDERKKEAARCELLWHTATAAVGALGIVVGTAFPPAAPGLILLAGLGPVMGYPFSRARLDPPRLDYYRTEGARAPITDPSVVSPAEGFVEFSPPTVAFSLDRAAAHLDAMMTSAERALGAYRRGSLPGLEARLSETWDHARHAQSAVHLATPVSANLLRNTALSAEKLRNLFRRALSEPTPRALEELVDNEVAEKLLLSGPIGERALTLRPLAEHRPESPETAFADFTTAVRASEAFVTSLVSNFPKSVDEFLGGGQGVPTQVLTPA